MNKLLFRNRRSSLWLNFPFMGKRNDPMDYIGIGTEEYGIDFPTRIKFAVDETLFSIRIQILGFGFSYFKHRM